MEITKLNLKPINDGKCILEADYIYSINGFLITVPKGFITDGASIPKSLQWIYDPYGKYIKAAVIHDYFYSKYNDTGINRTLADKIFDFIMKETGVNAKTRRKFYVAVKYFGKIFGRINWRMMDTLIGPLLTELKKQENTINYGTIF